MLVVSEEASVEMGLVDSCPPWVFFFGRGGDFSFEGTCVATAALVAGDSGREPSLCFNLFLFLFLFLFFRGGSPALLFLLLSWEAECNSEDLLAGRDGWETVGVLKVEEPWPDRSLWRDSLPEATCLFLF